MLTDLAAFEQQLAATPRDVNLHLAYADWLQENPDAWRRTAMTLDERTYLSCDVCGNWPDETGTIEHGRGCYTQSEDGGGTSYEEVIIDRTDWPYHRTPIYLHRSLWPWALRWESELSFGVEKTNGCLRDYCLGTDSRWPRCPNCGSEWIHAHQSRVKPTFALLLNHPGDEPCEEDCVSKTWVGQRNHCPKCSGSGKQLILGQLSLLVREMREAGDPRAEELAAIKIVESPRNYPETPFTLLSNKFMSRYPSRLDALRALHRRVFAVLTERCSWAEGHLTGGQLVVGHTKDCKWCDGLGWKVRPAESPAPFRS